MRIKKRVPQVWTQEELDRLAKSHYKGDVDICGGTAERPLELSVRLKRRPRAAGAAHVNIHGHAWIRAMDQSTVRADGDANVIAQDESFVKASGSATVRMIGNATACVKQEASLTAFDYSKADVRGSEVVKRKAFGSPKLTARARGRSKISAFNQSHIRLYQESRVTLFTDSTGAEYDPEARILEDPGIEKG